MISITEISTTDTTTTTTTNTSTEKQQQIIANLLKQRKKILSYSQQDIESSKSLEYESTGILKIAIPKNIKQKTKKKAVVYKIFNNT